jgi:hypothetical protein
MIRIWKDKVMVYFKASEESQSTDLNFFPQQKINEKS